MDRPTPPQPGTSPSGEAVPGRGGSGSMPTPRTVREMQGLARAFLARKGIEEARLEADLLVAHALGLDRLGMLLALEGPLQPGEVDRARDLLVRRGRREPVAYITGVREFYGRPFAVGEGCLIPRPETEGLVDGAKAWASEIDSDEPRIFDWGTGSGCLAITLALEFPNAQVGAADISAQALEWARRNGETFAVAVDWQEADGASALGNFGPVDLLVSNPPYVDPAGAAALAPEVRDYEPAQALYAPEGEPDYFLQAILKGAQSSLRPNGRILVELGHDQGARALALAESHGFRARVEKDLARIDRMLVAWRD